MDRAQVKKLAFVPHEHAMGIGIAHAEGATITLTDGRLLLDASGSAIANNIGFGRPEVIEAAKRAMERTSFALPTFATRERVALVERLREHWLPAGIERAWFGSGGSDAMDSAIRLARQYQIARGAPERWKIVGRELSYHGATIATLGIGGHTKRRSAFGPYFQDVGKAPACYCFRCPLGLSLPHCDVACVDEIERLFEREGPETIAALVAEPIVGSTAGALVPPDPYWPKLRALCDRHDVLLIADEVMTGFGRTGARFAVDHWDVVPDIVVSGKGLAGSYAPISGLFTTDRVVAPLAERSEDLMMFTYGGHPVSCAIADCVLEILEREDLVARAARAGEALRKRLEGLRSHRNVADVRGRGLLQAIELVADTASGEPFPVEARMAQRVGAESFRRGVMVYPGGTDPARDVVCLGPPFTIRDDELDRIVETLGEAVDAAVARV